MIAASATIVHTMKNLIMKIVGTFFMLVLSATQVYGYLDPGSASYLFQIILASLVGAAFAVKTFWIEIKEFLKRLFHKDPS